MSPDMSPPLRVGAHVEDPVNHSTLRLIFSESPFGPHIWNGGSVSSIYFLEDQF